MLVEIHGSEKVFTQDKVKVNIHTNLKKMIVDCNVPKTFKGNEKERQQWVNDANTEIINAKWKIYDDDKNGAMDEQECYNFLQSLKPTEPIDRDGFRLVFIDFDEDKDGCFDHKEMGDLMHKLLEGEKVTTVDGIQTTQHSNLKKLCDKKVSGPAKTFKGKETQREEWVREVCQYLVDINWDFYDDDGDNFMDESEAHNFVDNLVPKSTPDKAKFNHIYKTADKDGDGNIEREEVVDFLISLVVSKPPTIELLKKDIHISIAQVEVPVDKTKVME